jgi:hypothetical protein
MMRLRSVLNKSRLRAMLGITDSVYTNYLALILLALSFAYIGWLHWHLHRLSQEMQVNRDAIQWIFQYLANMDVALQEAFGLK